MRLFVLTLCLVFTPQFVYAVSSSNYKAYGYSGTGSKILKRSSYGSNKYKGYRTFKYYSHSSSYNKNSNGSAGVFGYKRSSGYRGSRSRIYARSNAGAIQRYNDPTYYRYVSVKQKVVAMPSGNYGRAMNRLRTAY